MAVTVSYQNNTTIVYHRSTSKYTINYEGEVLTATVTSNSPIIKNWVEEVISKYEDKKFGAIIGFDVTWRRGSLPILLHTAKKKKPATLQFCIAGNCLIIQLCHFNNGVIPEALKEFLINPNFTFASVKGEFKMAKLKRAYGLQCSKVATVHLPKQPLLKRIFCSGEVNSVKKIKKPKHVRVDLWEIWSLSTDQILYASLDAYASLYNTKLVVE